VIATSDLTSEIIKSFNTFDKRTDALSNLRKIGIDTFQKLGIPTTQHEEWKYTSLKDIVVSPISFQNSENASKITVAEIEKFLLAGKNVHLIVFENGVYNRSLSTINASNLLISSIGSNQNNPIVEAFLGKIAAIENESLVALNMAYINDGAFIYIPDNTIADVAIHILYINSSQNESTVQSVRNLIVAGENSRATITESYHSLNENGRGLTNSVTEIVVQQNANVELVKAQLESNQTSHISFTQVIQERNSTFDTVTVTLGGKLVRNNLHIKLNDVNCTSHLFGLYILNGEQHTDNHTLVDHAMPNCFSNELYKGIIDGGATGVFNGKIFVRKDAQKTNAFQSNKNILLSDNAQMNTKPQLEIFADDVKCSHGATTGQLDEEALFYLRARGIGEQSARTLLNIAFVGDVLNNIKTETLRSNLQVMAEKKLMGESK
jgi:Fe-S cluster assembly protein SufD